MLLLCAHAQLDEHEATVEKVVTAVCGGRTWRLVNNHLLFDAIPRKPVTQARRSSPHPPTHVQDSPTLPCRGATNLANETTLVFCVSMSMLSGRFDRPHRSLRCVRLSRLSSRLTVCIGHASERRTRRTRTTRTTARATSRRSAPRRRAATTTATSPRRNLTKTATKRCDTVVSDRDGVLCWRDEPFSVVVKLNHFCFCF